MSTPRFVDCKCGHTRALHPERLEEACATESCGCEEYRPVTLDAVKPFAPLPSSLAAKQAPEPADQVIARGKKSDRKGIVTLATRAHDAVAKLRSALAEDQQAAGVRAEIAALEAKLTAARARLKSGVAPTTVKTTDTGEFACTADGCDRTFDSGQGVAMHRRRAHEGFDPTQATA